MKQLRKLAALGLILLMLLSLAGCGGQNGNGGQAGDSQTQTTQPDGGSQTQANQPDGGTPDSDSATVDKNDLTVVRSMELQYANNFSVDYCANGCKIITDGGDREFLWVPEGAEVPDDTGDRIVLQAPLTKLGCFSTTHATLFHAIGALDKVNLVTTAQDKWYIEQMARQIADGTTLYVGKNSAPDYELIKAAAPQVILISANTLHGSEEVLSKLDELNVAYIADSQHLENHPLGRVEWVKLVGALLDMEEEADAYFNEAVAKVDAVAAAVAGETAQPTVIQTYVYKGTAYVRNGGDYVNKMLELAGGVYPFAELNPTEGGNTKMTIEEFYQDAVNTEVLIYDNTSDTSVKSVEDILEYGEFLGDIKAIQDGNVWGVNKNYWQSADDVATMIEDISTILYHPENADSLHYFYKMPATAEEAVEAQGPADVQKPADNKPADAQEDYDGKLVPDGKLKLDYAENFSIDLYKGGYRMIHAGTGGLSYLVVPEGMKVPADAPADAVVLQQPIDRVYMASTGMVSLIDAIGALDHVKLVSTDRDGWYLDGVTSAMDSGKITYSGHYKEPDYELMVANNIQFHVDTTMIDNSPEVLDKMKELGIPSLVENSSKEGHPLARVEWVKLFGVLFNMEKEANDYFETQKKLVEDASGEESSGKTVAMGYITSTDKCYARNGGDYMAQMIEMAGGTYILADMNPEKSGNTNMTFEEFYASNKDADCIFYVNFARSFGSLQEMIDYNPLFADFKAVQNGNVWITSPDFTQSTAAIASIISDMHTVLFSDDPNVTTDHLIKLNAQ